MGIEQALAILLAKSICSVIVSSGSVTVNNTDTVRIYDTVVQVTQVHDTVVINDTVQIVLTFYDTVNTVDTVLSVRCDPNEYLAIAAMQYNVDPLVIEFINQEFGYNEGWIFYLSSFQLQMTQQSANVYDMYGYIDYWTTDWSGYYPLEFLWRMTFVGDDPADPRDWQISDPPAYSPEHQPGLRLIPEAANSNRTLH